MNCNHSPALDSSTLGAIQRRIVLVLAVAQVFGGVGVATGAAVGALLAADMAFPIRSAALRRRHRSPARR